MADSNRVIAVGASGTEYSLFVHPIGTTYRSIAGVYVFLNSSPTQTWKALYVGESSDLERRLNSNLQGHNAWPRIRQHNPSHIATMAVNGAAERRLQIETDLRHGLKPPCNLQ